MAKDILRTLIVSATRDFVKQLSGTEFLKDLNNEFICSEPDDVSLDLSQKMVDMKIGLDIASITLKKQVDQIILISGDSDFVPAAKLARREGLDIILDPMWNNIKPHLFEHIDGLMSICKKPIRPF